MGLSDSFDSVDVKATLVRMAKAEDDEWALYEKISEIPNLNVYELAKQMGWSTGKTRGAVKRQEEEGLIKIEKSIRNGRACGPGDGDSPAGDAHARRVG